MNKKEQLDLFRIKSDIFFDKNFNPYSRKYLEYLIELSVKLEDYELCSKIRDHIKVRFL